MNVKNTKVSLTNFRFSLQNQNLQNAIWDLSWFLLPTNELQRIITHLLNRLQNGAVLTIGPFSELDFVTCTNVSNVTIDRFYL